MSPRNWKMRLEDILISIERIQTYIEGMNYSQWSHDHKTIDAVTRNLEIIGEAANNIPWGIITRFPDIPWAHMRGMRNMLAHEYFGVDIEVIWKTAIEDLPELKKQIERIDVHRL